MVQMAHNSIQFQHNFKLWRRKGIDPHVTIYRIIVIIAVNDGNCGHVFLLDWYLKRSN